ncbi:MAG TPA: phosphoglycerate kinase [Longimicrobiales bacterium]|nr:phosphoglycerate kinase [Longimicrobiales bacterium]
MKQKTIRDLPDSALSGRRVLMRVDYNVPLAGGTITDDARITATLPTLRYLLERDARIVLMSHMGRPKGEWKDGLSLRPAAEHLAELLDAPVTFVSDVVGSDARGTAAALRDGEVLVLENTRFLPGEETNDPHLAEELAGLGDIYVNDAFGAAHRAHASTVGAAEHMKREGKPAVAGLLMESELRFLGGALESPDRPFVAILGGAKISGKIDVIDNLLPRVDRLLIGGAMANTFFRAMGLSVGDSLVEEDRVEMAASLLERAGDKLVLPTDCVVAEEVSSKATTRSVTREEVPDGWKILDIGPRSVSRFNGELDGARTVIWNGPVGMFELEPFAGGTEGVARAVADLTDQGATTIIGGGDTAAAVDAAGLSRRMTHVSTGGGASLEFLEGRVLPGVAVLDDKEGS